MNREKAFFFVVKRDPYPPPFPQPRTQGSLCAGRGLKRTVAKAVKIIHNFWIILSRGMYEQGRGAFYRLLNVVSVC